MGDLSSLVQKLHRQGVSLIKIATQLGLARNTVRKYVRQPSVPPAPKPRPLRASQLDPYEAYLLKRWREGCRNAALLHREISEMGYRGAQTMVRASIAYLRKHPEQATHDHPRKERAASALLIEHITNEGRSRWDTKPYDAGQGWSVSMTEKPCKKPGI